jgi:hypothetical protein
MNFSKSRWVQDFDNQQLAHKKAKQQGKQIGGPGISLQAGFNVLP